MYLGNSCQSAVLSSLVRSALTEVCFPLDSASMGLFPNFSTMGPAQKPMNFALPLPLASCSVCQLNFNSQSQASSHFRGTRHGRKLRTLEVPLARRSAADAVATETARRSSSPSLPPASTGATESLPATRAALSSCSTAEPTCDPTPAPNPSAPGETAGGEEREMEEEKEGETEEKKEGETEEKKEGETEEEKAKRLLYCSLCKVAVNSASQLEAHNNGIKHKTMQEARTGGGAIKSFLRPGVKGRPAAPTTAATGLQNRTFHCEICDVHVNSETQLKQHISSRRHKDRAAGKPAKPKYSPYSKSSRTTSPLSVCLKPLAAQLLSGFLAGSRVSPLSLSSAPAVAASLFQTQALLCPAPGPLRTPHAPLLFTPYGPRPNPGQNTTLHISLS